MRPRIPICRTSVPELLLFSLILSTTAFGATSDVSASTATTTAKTKAKSDKILLSRIRSLTLRHGQMTTSRRVSPIPQLKCVGGDAKGLHDVDVMKCTNMDADYDDDDVSWSCEATLPHFFKLGATDVICEGYASSDDPFVLKGSCGVEYILMLTEAGHKKYPKTEEQLKEEKKKMEEEEDKKKDDTPKSVTTWSGLVEFLLWLLFIVGFFAFIAWRAYKAPEHPPGGAWAGEGFGPGGPGGGGGGGGGGPGDGWGGGGGGDNWRGYRDDPPPYDHPPYGKTRPTSSRRTTGGSNYSARQQQQAQQPAQEQWRPGFWSGAATGAAATYLANNASGLRGQSSRRSEYDQRERDRERAAQERERAAQERERAAQERERLAQERAPRYGGPGGWRSSSYGGSSYGGEESGSSAYEHTSTGFGQSRRR